MTLYVGVTPIPTTVPHRFPFSTIGYKFSSRYIIRSYLRVTRMALALQDTYGPKKVSETTDMTASDMDIS